MTMCKCGVCRECDEQIVNNVGDLSGGVSPEVSLSGQLRGLHLLTSSLLNRNIPIPTGLSAYFLSTPHIGYAPSSREGV